jgi:hypothetical protein
MTMTTTAVAMGGVISKDDETGTSSRAAATASAPSNVLSAPPQTVVGRYHSWEGRGLEAVVLR